MGHVHTEVPNLYVLFRMPPGDHDGHSQGPGHLELAELAEPAAAEPAVPELAVSLVPSVQHPVASSMPHPPDRITHG